jgi:hypothetical protein
MRNAYKILVLKSDRDHLTEISIYGRRLSKYGAWTAKFEVLAVVTA